MYVSGVSMSFGERRKSLNSFAMQLRDTVSDKPIWGNHFAKLNTMEEYKEVLQVAVLPNPLKLYLQKETF